MEYIIELFVVVINGIYGYLFVPFAVCNLAYVVFKTFNKTQALKDTIVLADKIFYYAGIAYLVLFILNTLLITIIYVDYDIYGKYAIAYWVQPLAWFICSQLIGFYFIKKYSLFRIVISIFLLISFEYYTILLSTIMRDYPDVDWIKLLKPTFIYVLLFVKSLAYGFFCFAFAIRNKTKRNNDVLDERI